MVLYFLIGKYYVFVIVIALHDAGFLFVISLCLTPSGLAFKIVPDDLVVMAEKMLREKLSMCLLLWQVATLKKEITQARTQGAKDHGVYDCISDITCLRKVIQDDIGCRPQ